MSLNWPLPECLHAFVASSKSFPSLLKIRPDCRLSYAECREMRQTSWWSDTGMSEVLCAHSGNRPVWGIDHSNNDTSCFLPVVIYEEQWSGLECAAMLFKTARDNGVSFFCSGCSRQPLIKLSNTKFNENPFTFFRVAMFWHPVTDI